MQEFKKLTILYAAARVYETGYINGWKDNMEQEERSWLHK